MTSVADSRGVNHKAQSPVATIAARLLLRTPRSVEQDPELSLLAVVVPPQSRLARLLADQSRR